MANQRAGLAKYLGKAQCFIARFDSIQHAGNVPKVLLKDIYPVLPNGHKIALRKNRIKKDNLWVVCDHMWVNFINNAEPFAINYQNNSYEIFHNEWVQFKATVGSYNINRNDVIKANALYFKQVQAENNQLFKRYLNWRSNENLQRQIELDRIYQNYLGHNYDFETMKLLQQNIVKEYNSEKSKKLRSLKAKQKRRLAKYKRTKKSKIDYDLLNIKNIMVLDKHKAPLSINAPIDLKGRLKLDKKRLNDYAYTSYLTVRTLKETADESK